MFGRKRTNARLSHEFFERAFSSNAVEISRHITFADGWILVEEQGRVAVATSSARKVERVGQDSCGKYA